jgi:hypothetical protein
MFLIAFLALVTTVVLQSVRLREAASREQQLLAELRRQRLQAEAARLSEAMLLEQARAQLRASEVAKPGDR